MAIATYSAFNTAIANPVIVAPVNITTIATVAGRVYDLWVPQVPVGVAPTTAVVPTRATAGALPMENSSSTLGIIAARFSSMNPGVYLICDRLSHQGGLSGTVATAQTTNLPTAALTRYTSGVGVMAMLTIYTQIGSSGATVSVSYTDTTPTAGNASPSIVIGGTGFREANRGLILPLASGDVGITSVESVTISISTGTVGNLGVTLFKPLFAVLVDQVNTVAVCDFVTGSCGGGIPEVVDNACLFVMCMSGSTNAMASGVIAMDEH